MPNEIFPFGRPVRPCPPSATGRRRVFILGAYPSALHVAWKPPAGAWKGIRAIAVDNEPEPFWDGADQEQRVGTWKATVGFRPEWGEIDVARDLNGSSGKWVVRNVLEALHVTRADCWITDALDTYRCSSDLAARLKDTYVPAAEKLGLPAASLREHPSEDGIVNESKAHHRDRLVGELRDAAPERIVTLGNAALRVLRDLVGAAHLPRVLSSNADEYASEFDVVLSHGPVKVLPLAHPAAPKPYQVAHAAWVSSRATRSTT